MRCMVEPIVIGFGLTTEAISMDPALTQWAANLIEGGQQQPTMVIVTFFAKIKGLDDDVMFTPLLINFIALTPGNK